MIFMISLYEEHQNSTFYALIMTRHIRRTQCLSNCLTYKRMVLDKNNILPALREVKQYIDAKDTTYWWHLTTITNVSLLINVHYPVKYARVILG